MGAAATAILESPPGPVSLHRANAIVEKLTHHKAHVSRVFPGPKGLTGLVISGSQGPVISWMTNTRSAVVVGGVVDTQTNQNLTLQATAKYALAPTSVEKPEAPASPSDVDLKTVASTSDAKAHSGAASSPEAALQDFLSTSRNGSLVEIYQPGLSGPHTLYAFVDPNCIFCHKFFDYVQAHLDQLKSAGVRVVYVPVAILKQSSIAKAAEVAKEGWSALSRDEKGFETSTEEGGLDGLSGADLVRYAQPVRTNTEWLKNLAAANHAGEGTPFLVWQAGNGQAYYLDGAPTGKGFQAVLDSMQNGWAPKSPQS